MKSKIVCVIILSLLLVTSAGAYNYVEEVEKPDIIGNTETLYYKAIIFQYIIDLEKKMKDLDEQIKKEIDKADDR